MIFCLAREKYLSTLGLKNVIFIWNDVTAVLNQVKKNYSLVNIR